MVNKNIKVSVIMSIYNESIEEINDSIQSIINQDFKGFEFIIVIDNPCRHDLVDYIYNITGNFDNIKIIINKENIGLAESMNIAARTAKGEYLARMDADDIAMPNRLSVQYSLMQSNEYDLTCTLFSYIDENGNKLNRKIDFSLGERLTERLPYDNTIHHPTVMMKKATFHKVNGYRNFPCSQDYDLWLRLYNIKANMTLIPLVLLKYRLRKDSVSEKKKMMQLLTIWYIQDLNQERLQNGKDSFSDKNYYDYLKKNKAYDMNYIANFLSDKKKKDVIDEIRGKKGYRLVRFFMMVRLYMTSCFYRKYYNRLTVNKIKILINQLSCF